MIQKTYAQLTREIQALQAHAEKLRAAELQGVITKLNETIAKHGLKAEDLRFAGAGSASSAPVRASRQAASSASRSASTTSGAKYGDGHGNSWGGRGPRPAWLRDALSKGRTLESFALSGNESLDSAPAAQGSASGKAKAKTQSSAAKSPLPPLYSHPKSGQTWSGRGPKPAWLNQGLKKRGVSLNDFLISARESGANAAEAAGLAAHATPGSSKTLRPAKAAAAPQSNGLKKRSLAEKISSRTKASSANTARADAASAPRASPAPTAAAKKTASKKADANKSPEASAAPAPAKTTARKSGTAKTSEPVEATVAVTPTAPAKKAASKSPVKTATKSQKKPAAKKIGPAPKRIASSMAPPADTPALSSTIVSTDSMTVQDSSDDGNQKLTSDV